MDLIPENTDAQQRENWAKAFAIAKMHADVGNAKPATEAVKGSTTAAAKAKPARSAAARVQRSELGR